MADDDDESVSSTKTLVTRGGSKRKLASLDASSKAVEEDVIKEAGNEETGKDRTSSSSSASSSAADSAEVPRLIPSKLRVVDLRRELRARGLPSSGLKAQLIEKLEQALEMEELEGEKEPDLPEIMECDEVRQRERLPMRAIRWPSELISLNCVCYISCILNETHSRKMKKNHHHHNVNLRIRRRPLRAVANQPRHHLLVASRAV